MNEKLRVLLVGGAWHGGNCLGLARGFRDGGHAVHLVAPSSYVWPASGGLVERAILRVLSPARQRHYNLAILSAARRMVPHMAVVYKGTDVHPQTLVQLRAMGIWRANVYPDNSVQRHRGLDPSIFQHFDHVFHTKRFGIGDFKRQFGITSVSYLPHGFDPYVHRPFADPALTAAWACDVSFIGTWSPRKEHVLADLRRALAPGQLRIWGGQWGSRSDPVLDDAIAGTTVVGDLYALAVSATRINLGLLSERREGASEDDQITSRTFHIPACGGFLLHERTDDVTERFVPGEEIACFSTIDELVAKVRYYLVHSGERRTIAHAGHRRCVAENGLARRAADIVETYTAAQTAGAPE